VSVLAYHPEPGAAVVLTDDQLAHLRLAGWMLKSEYDEQQAAIAAQAAAAAAQAAAVQAPKSAPTSTSDGK
jgi:hypothetical protein